MRHLHLRGRSLRKMLGMGSSRRARSVEDVPRRSTSHNRHAKAYVSIRRPFHRRMAQRHAVGRRFLCVLPSSSFLPSGFLPSISCRLRRVVPRRGPPRVLGRRRDLFIRVDPFVSNEPIGSCSTTRACCTCTGGVASKRRRHVGRTCGIRKGRNVVDGRPRDGREGDDAWNGEEKRKEEEIT